MKVIVIGAGVMGLTLATELDNRGVLVEIYERGCSVGDKACSWLAGGMLAPWCERENAPLAVQQYGKKSYQWWRNYLQKEGDLYANGTLVIAQSRDRQELLRFSRRTENFEWLDGEALRDLEPDLADRFSRSLYFADEGHLNPRTSLQFLVERLQKKGVAIHFNSMVDPKSFSQDIVVDCRGIKSKEDWNGIRGVRGEMLIIKTEEVTFQRPIRLLHPRFPLYLVPRKEGQFMVGATMIESEKRHSVTVRSMLELLGSAYAIHPAFAEAEIVETGCDVRPAFPDNLPRIKQEKNIWSINGLYRHGFLLAPIMAEKAANAILDQNYKLEQLYEYSCK
ncbi:glycine oxidase ThiO [Marinomonas agarivorans]|nr:glycine oxidase ThiO [Marinomonas agarivorans]